MKVSIQSFHESFCIINPEKKSLKILRQDCSLRDLILKLVSWFQILTSSKKYSPFTLNSTLNCIVLKIRSIKVAFSPWNARIFAHTVSLHLCKTMSRILKNINDRRVQGCSHIQCKYMKAPMHLQRCRRAPKVCACKNVKCKPRCVSDKKVRDKSVLLLCFSFPLRNVQGR